MKNLMKKEGLNLVMVALPFIYLAYLYGGLPAEVPVHWNASGEMDRMGSKSELWMIIFVMPLLSYVILSAIPMVDPKKKIEKMGGKFQSLKTMLVICFSMLAFYIIYVAAHPEAMRISALAIFLGLLFMGLGNFFKTLQPNYFLGIRTPWTLENETVWKSTHRMAGVLWLVGGLVMVVAGLLLNGPAVSILIVGVAIAVTVVPIGYSWVAFNKTT